VHLSENVLCSCVRGATGTDELGPSARRG